jgi:hypothetical protein
VKKAHDSRLTTHRKNGTAESEERGVKKVNDVLALQVLKIEYDNAKKELHENRL